MGDRLSRRPMTARARRLQCAGFVARLLVSCVLPLGAAAAQRTDVTSDLLLTHARVIDVRTGAVRADQALAVRGDTIVAIGTTAELQGMRARRTVDVAGRYVLPALWDMHMHFGGGDSLIAENRLLLPLFVANGIAAVRDAAGDLSPTVLAWRDSVARGTLAGPTIFTSGPKLEGINSIWPGDLEVGSRAEVDAGLDALQAMRVDFVKLTDNTLDPALFRYALGEIAKRGLRSSAHIPASVPVREAVSLGLGSIEHLSYAIRAGTEREGAAPSRDVMADFDEATAVATYRLMAERGTAITPTLNISRVLAWLDSEDHSHDAYLQYIGPGLQATYRWRVERAATADAAAIARRHALYTFTAGKLPLLQRAGVLILAGTDAGFLNSYDYPGRGLHDELEQMVKAGLTPLEALQGATINGARFLGRSDRHGTLEVGHAADILVLDRNPLTDIRATRSIRSLVLRGQLLDRAALDAMLAGVARDVRLLPTHPAR
jgi:imidazolonepropionase-like amidohydrolase